MWLVWRMFTFIPLTQKRHPSATVLAGKGWPPMSHHCSYLCKKDFGRRGISDLSNLSKFKSAQFSRGSMEIWKLSVLQWCKIIPQSAWVESWGWQFSLDDPLTKQGHSWMNPGSSDRVDLRAIRAQCIDGPGPTPPKLGSPNCIGHEA